jgi:hypothetical protein
MRVRGWWEYSRVTKKWFRLRESCYGQATSDFPDEIMRYRYL